MTSMPKVLSPREIEEWGLPEMIPIFPPDEILIIEAKWSKNDLQEMAIEYFLDPYGDKQLLVEKLVYVGALDENGDRTELPVDILKEVPYIISSPKRFCCRLCGACVPENLLERGRGLDRISWLREHYKVEHPGKWGKGEAMRSHTEKSLPNFALQTYPKIWNVIDREKLRKYCEDIWGVPVTAEASDYLGRLLARRVDQLKTYLPLPLIDHRGLTAQDMYRAASALFA